MTTRTLQAGDLGIDYSLARPAHAQMVASGARYAIRYSAGAASAPTHPSHAAVAKKLITPSEHAQLLADGEDIVANSEWYEGRITEKVQQHPVRGEQPLHGLEALFSVARLDLGAKVPHDHPDMVEYVSQAAKADAAADLALWRSCGHAKGASIYVSWDAAPVQSKWAAVDAYLDTYGTALGGWYFADCYAGTPYLKHALGIALIRYGWRPNAGSWSGDGLPYQPDTTSPAKRAALVAQAVKATPAHLWQTGNYWFGNGADEDLIVRGPVGSHYDALGAKPVTPTPTPNTPTGSDVPTTGTWATRWTNQRTGVKRTAADWMLRTLNVGLDVQAKVTTIAADVKAIRALLEQQSKS